MGKLIVHTGNINGSPVGVEILGTLTGTPEENARIGLSLTIPVSQVTRHVFTNNYNILNSIRLSISLNKIDYNNIEIHCHSVNKTNPTIIKLTSNWRDTCFPFSPVDL